MQVIETIAGIREAVRNRGRVALVPTMGNLHEGHLTLMRSAREGADCVVAYIFVNRLQFAPSEDFSRYPRTMDDDQRKLRALGVDILFAPTESELYPESQEFMVELPPIATELCGAFRPGHFRGMATVVMKMFNITRPHIALFGKKDYQQLFVVRRMVQQFAMPVEIVASDTVRDPDGLALSSRNAYLSADERVEAVRLQRVLQDVVVGLTRDRNDLHAMQDDATRELNAHGWRAEYVAVRRQSDLGVAGPDDRELVVMGAAWLGKTRLIDSIEVNI